MKPRGKHIILRTSLSFIFWFATTSISNLFGKRYLNMGGNPLVLTFMSFLFSPFVWLCHELATFFSCIYFAQYTTASPNHYKTGQTLKQMPDNYDRALISIESSGGLPICSTSASINSISTHNRYSSNSNKHSLSNTNLQVINHIWAPLSSLIRYKEKFTSGWSNYAVLPVAVLHVLNTHLTNLSLQSSDIKFTYTIKASEPLVTLLLSYFIFRKRPSKFQILTLIPIPTGVLISTLSDFSFTTRALVTSLLSVLITSTRSILYKIDSQSLPPSTFKTYTIVSSISCLLTAPLLLLTNLHQLQDLITRTGSLSENTNLRDTALMLHKGDTTLGDPHPYPVPVFSISLSFCLFLASLFHFSYNYFSLDVLNAVSDPLSHSVGGVVKRVVVVVMSTIVFPAQISLLNIAGMVITNTGVIAYSIMTSAFKQESSGQNTYLNQYTARMMIDPDDLKMRNDRSSSFFLLRFFNQRWIVRRKKIWMWTVCLFVVLGWSLFDVGLKNNHEPMLHRRSRHSSYQRKLLKNELGELNIFNDASHSMGFFRCIVGLQFLFHHLVQHYLYEYAGGNRSAEISNHLQKYPQSILILHENTMNMTLREMVMLEAIQNSLLSLGFAVEDCNLLSCTNYHPNINLTNYKDTITIFIKETLSEASDWVRAHQSQKIYKNIPQSNLLAFTTIPASSIDIYALTPINHQQKFKRKRATLNHSLRLPHPAFLIPHSLRKCITSANIDTLILLTYPIPLIKTLHNHISKSYNSNYTHAIVSLHDLTQRLHDPSHLDSPSQTILNLVCRARVVVLTDHDVVAMVAMGLGLPVIFLGDEEEMNSGFWGVAGCEVSLNNTNHRSAIQRKNIVPIAKKRISDAIIAVNSIVSLHGNR